MLLKGVILAFGIFGQVCLAQLGNTNEGRTSQVIGGSQISDKSKHKWMALMEGKQRISLFKDKVTYCGGTLIAKRWVVSAAHCYLGDPSVEDASKWTASVGTLHPYDWVHRYLLNPIGWLLRKPEWQSWRLQVDRIFTHPDFRDNSTLMFDNDIALLKLKEDAPVGKHPHVGTLDLPTANDIRVPEAGSHCTVAGWGCTADGGAIQDQEMEVTLPVLSKSECNSYWPRMSDNQFCAGRAGEGKSVCSGDSGGPLECTNATKPFLAGIVSFANKGNPANYPSGFLYVAKYVDWINRIMAAN